MVVEREVFAGSGTAFRISEIPFMDNHRDVLPTSRNGLLPDYVPRLRGSLFFTDSVFAVESEHVWMSVPLRSARAVVTIVETTDGAETGHVVLGVLGSVALVLFLVVIIVPLVRWRKRWGSSTTESRTSSRRTHTRIVSGYHKDVVAPLLEEQPQGMLINQGASMVTQPPQSEPSHPPPAAALLSWKILDKLPNFDEESSESSLGKPLDPKDRTFPEDEPSVRLVDADRRSAALPPIPVSNEPSRSSTLVAPTTPTSPLVNAFQRTVSLVASDTPSIASTNSPVTFRYPSLTSSSSKSSVPTPEMQGSSQTKQKSASFTHTPSWLPKSLVPGSEGSSPNETWWRIPSMPPIPESVHSGSISSIHLGVEVAKKDVSSPSPTAYLREPSAIAGPSAVRHVRELSGEALTQISLSRSSTQHTDKSNQPSVERDDRRMSALTHGTFGRKGVAESRDGSIGRPSMSEEGVLVTPVSPTRPDDPSLRRAKRRTLDYPREPSPPLEPTPLSAPPPLHTIRPGHPLRPSRPTSQPIPDPQSPEGAGPEGESTAPYAHNEEASSSSEHLIPSGDTAPLLPELPSLPQLSPLAFEFRLDSAPASRSNSVSTGRFSRKSIRSKGKGHSKTPSKGSTATGLSSGTGSKRSLRSLASFSSGRSGSSHSHSKSRERTKHSRRVTFGDQTSATPPPVPSPVPILEVPTSTPIPAQIAEPPSRKRPPRPLPTLPATIIVDYNMPLPGQSNPISLQGRR